MRLSGICVYEHEATAYADPESEAQIQEAVGRLVQGKTLIVVAHRLATIQNAQQILVVDQGRIIAAGTQEELLQGCPLYRTMWEQHLGAADRAEDDQESSCSAAGAKKQQGKE